MDESDFKELNQEFLAANDILIISHRKPDGDACGSALALYFYLISRDKRARLFMSDPAPFYFSFLPGFEEISDDRDLLTQKWDLVVLVDVSDFTISGVAEEFIKNNRVVNFDHHWSNSHYGQINVVDDSASSTCEVLFNFFQAIKFPFDRKIATCLLNGLLTDTGNLINGGTSVKAISVVANLLEQGAKIHRITDIISKNKSLAGLKLWGLALSRLTFNKKLNLAYTYIKEEDLVEYKVEEEEVAGLANFLNALSDVSLIMVLKIGKNKTEVSLRTNKDNINVAQLAGIFGGGGHKKAAGFTVPWAVKEQDGQIEVV